MKTASLTHRSLALIGAGIICLATPLASFAATVTWDGDTNNSWSNPGNWVGGVSPIGGDDVVFSSLAAPAFNPNPGTIAATSVSGFRSITFNNTQTSPLTLAGAVIFLSAPGGGSPSLVHSKISSNSTVTLQNSVRFVADQVWQIDTGATLLKNGGTLFNDGVGGTFSFEKTGGGTLRLAAPVAGDFGGVGKEFKISAGTVEIASAFNQLGSASNTIVFNGGQLAKTDTTLLTQSRAMSVTSNGGTINVGGGTAWVQDGSIAFTGNLTKTGANTFVIQGASANTGSGGMIINTGTVALGKADGTNALAGNTSVNAGGTLLWSQNNQIADTASVTINSGGLLNLNGRQETLASLTVASGANLFSTGAGGNLETTGTMTLNATTGTNIINSNSVLKGNTLNVAGAILNVAGSGTSGRLETGSGGLIFSAGSIILNNGDVGGEFRLGGNAIINSSSTLVITDNTVGVVRGFVNLGSSDRTFTVNKIAGPQLSDFRISTVVTGTGGLIKDGAGTMVLGDNLSSNSIANTYTGNTTVSAGELILADNTSLLFNIGASGVNNQINGIGTLTLDGDFRFNLASAGTVVGNSWNVINVGTLAETFGGTFSVFSTVGSFTNNSGVWSINESGANYQFSQATGLLTVVPEPTSLALLSVCLMAMVAFHRRRRATA